MARPSYHLSAWMLLLLLSWARVNAAILPPVIGTLVGGLLEVPPDALPVYRFWSPVVGKHFYTLDEAEKAKLLSRYSRVWTYEGVAFRAFASPVAILHHPPFTCTVGHSDDATIQRQLVPLFEQYGVDAVFSGHSHAYERYLSNGIHYVVTGGGGAPLYELAVDTVPPLRQFGLSAHHYCVVDVNPSAGTLTIAATDLNGHVFDAVVLSQ